MSLAVYSWRSLLRHALIGVAGDFGYVPPLDANQPSRTRAARRVQIPLVVDIGHTRGKRVFAAQGDLPGFALTRGRDFVPVAHHRLAKRLAVDRPGWTMIMRRAFFGAVIDVREDAELVFRVLVENLPLRTILGQVLGDKILIGTGLLNKRAHFFTAF